MIACPQVGAGGGVAGLAQALRAIDCRTGEATAFAFGRLFGVDGRLMPVLTACLTLYVAFFAISLLTGRSRLGISALTPRMLTLGLVLTFATSWAAYQNVIWTLASGAPDQIAGVLAGTRGSATVAFADRLDQVFAAIGDAADQAGKPGAASETGIAPASATVGGFSSSTALWLCAVLLMLGTAGVLVTARIALATLLAIGPLFVILALFGGTRGLFAGWLKAVVMFALVPLLAVLVGSGGLAALVPLVRTIAAAGGQPEGRDVAVLFVAVCIYCVLMVMVLKTAGTIIGGWRLPGMSDRAGVGQNPNWDGRRGGFEPRGLLAPAMATTAGGQASGERVRAIVATMPVVADRAPSASGGEIGRGRVLSAQIVSHGGEDASPARTIDRRVQGIGSRFRAAPPALSKGHVS